MQTPQELQQFLNCHPVIARILWNRELRTQAELETFLNPTLKNLPQPFVLLDMEKGVQRIAKAIQQNEKIAVYADYDVDGTCGASVLHDFFKQLGISLTVYQPNRFTEGYGVHNSAIQRLIDQQTKCIITVDCGITAIEPAQLAQSQGVDMVILDHHKLGPSLPEAFAVINPQRPDDSSGLKNLCGAGIAFFFAIALRTYLRESGFFQNREEPNLLKLLDLVAIATIADMVDVRGVNRILVYYGLQLMSKNPRPGIQAMMTAAKIKQPNAMHCGFVFGPRINAAGRLKNAHAAFELLTSTDSLSAQNLALELEALNQERRQTQDQVYQEARIQAQEQIQNPIWSELAKNTPAAALGPWPRALVLYSEHWHEGVVGIVASKIVEEFGRPAFILSQQEGTLPETLKGSVRSISKIDILAALSNETVAQHLLNFGGHAHAGGVRLEKTKLQDFLIAINQHLAITTDHSHFLRERKFDAEVLLDEINPRLIQELQNLEPFGYKFPEPILKLSNPQIIQKKIMKEKHLKLKITDHSAQNSFDAVWFNAFQNLDPSMLDDIFPNTFWISPQWNEWQGTRKLQLQIKHAEKT